MMISINDIDLNDEEAADAAIKSVVNGIGSLKKLYISLAGM